MMTVDRKLTELPAPYTDLVIEKSNLLLRANMVETQQQFDEAANYLPKRQPLKPDWRPPRNNLGSALSH
ncbi:MAG: hypothetical protein R3C14_34775 [Caldilineaceae bacterium]